MVLSAECVHTLMREAIFVGNVQLVLNLINKEGADVHAKDEIENTLLHLVAARGSIHAQHSIRLKGISSVEVNLYLAKILIERGLDVNSVNRFNQTPLHLAIERQNLLVIDHLISCGSNVNLVDANGNSPLHILSGALQNWDDKDQLESLLKVARKLLEKNANVNVQNRNLCTPLHYAAGESNFELVKLFLENEADVGVKNHFGGIPLNKAASGADLKTIKLLVDYGSDVNHTDEENLAPIHEACSQNVIRIIKFLMERGADINVPGRDKWTPIMWSLRAEDTKIIDNPVQLNFHQGRANTLKFLLEKGADVNLVGSDGNNVLTVRGFRPEVPDDYLYLIILRHLAKMELLNLTICNSLRATIQEKKDFSDYFTKCKEELMAAKNTKIHPDCMVTFFNLLVDDKSKLVNYTRNESLMKSLKNSSLKKRFPIYRHSIKEKLAKAVKRRCLTDKAADWLKHQFPAGSNPSHLIIDKILSYLKKGDLQNLYELNSKKITD